MFEKYYGLANEKNAVFNNMNTAFNVASLNKIFTAALIMRLVEQGRLSLDDRLGDLLPDEKMSENAAEIRVRHLLSHTSGIVNSLDTLNFDPGSDFSYSNMGYGLLGGIVAKAVGLPYDDTLHLEILAPLGMARTASYAFSRFNENAPLAIAYEPNFDRFDDGVFEEVPNPSMQIYSGGSAGGYYSSAPDLLRFAEGLRKGDIISEASLAEMRKPKTELGTDKYGYGIMLWHGDGIWGHAGDLPGADADLEFYGDTGVVAIVLANRNHVNPPVLGRILALYNR